MNYLYFPFCVATKLQIFHKIAINICTIQWCLIISVKTPYQHMNYSANIYQKLLNLWGNSIFCYKDFMKRLQDKQNYFFCKITYKKFGLYLIISPHQRIRGRVYKTLRTLIYSPMFPHSLEIKYIFLLVLKIFFL